MPKDDIPVPFPSAPFGKIGMTAHIYPLEGYYMHLADRDQPAPKHSDADHTGPG